jgi:hypothetical protein
LNSSTKGVLKREALKRGGEEIDRSDAISCTAAMDADAMLSPTTSAMLKCRDIEERVVKT